MLSAELRHLKQILFAPLYCMVSGQWMFRMWFASLPTLPDLLPPFMAFPFLDVYMVPEIHVLPATYKKGKPQKLPHAQN